ncbi:response regulator transcription factor [Haloarchaeobius amylolyticus]|uniref:response regulator transcription factor n=1 Tax=Haloarchaeobius amylolyticus TaxID=1198296 RepID=UPI00226E9A10|nr:response regulator [Haloarchaeobius amylolyticus]
MTQGDAPDDGSAGGETTVLVVDDDEDLAETYALWLGSDYDVRVANDGETALERYDPAVDVVLLDRRMPSVSGDEVARELRTRDSSCLIAIVTAVGPAFDLLDVPFDEYLLKPVDREGVLETVERLAALADVGVEPLREYYALQSTLSILERLEYRDAEANDQLERLRGRLGRKREAVCEAVDEAELAALPIDLPPCELEQ